MKNNIVFKHTLVSLRRTLFFSLGIIFFLPHSIESARKNGLGIAAHFMHNLQSILPQKKQKVAIWIRQWVGSEKDLNAATTYLNNLIEELSQNQSIEPIIMIITKPNNPMLNIQLDGIDKNNVRILTSDNFESFSDPLNTLIQETPAGVPVLTISPGTQVSSSNSLAGFSRLMKKGLASITSSQEDEKLEQAEKNEKKRVYAYGWEFAYGDFDQDRHFAACLDNKNWCHAWKMPSYRNDGSAPGKGWYNTCAILSPDLIALLKKDPIPELVDTGKAGILTVLNGSTGTVEKIPVGGVEEMFMMGTAVKADPNATFVLDTEETLFAGVKTGTVVSYNDKLTRKVAVGSFYGNILNPENPRYLQDHLIVLKSKQEEPAILA